LPRLDQPDVGQSILVHANQLSIVPKGRLS
jgi:hypothetical protein